MLAKEATSVPSFQFGDLSGFGDLRVSDTPASENGAATEATASVEEAAEEVVPPIEASYVIVSPEKEVRRDEQVQAQASPKPAPKSWASLVGVQPGLGDAMRSSGHVKPAPPPVTKPVSNGSVRLQPRGLINTGNSCFANATLQALLSCPPFLNLLASIKSRNIPQVRTSLAHLLILNIRIKSNYQLNSIISAYIIQIMQSLLRWISLHKRMCKKEFRC